jgi:hypothetical protein
MNISLEDISNLKKSSLIDVKLPSPEVEIEPIVEENSPTEEEIIYSKIIAINPILENLVNDLYLVSSRTEEQIQKVEMINQLRLVETVTYNQLLAIAKRIIASEESYTIKEIITRLIAVVAVSQGRAFKGFRLMLEAGVIEAIPGKRYCLTGSLLSKRLQ